MTRDMIFGLGIGDIIQLKMEDEKPFFIWSLKAGEDFGIS